MKRLVIVVLLLVAGLATYNAWVSIPVTRALTRENRVTMVAYRRWLVDPNVIVLDLWEVGGEASMADVDRNLFKAAAALKDRHFAAVILAYRGRARFRLDGPHFHELGQEWPSENPVYMVRTLPAHVRSLNGSDAFPEPMGGWIYVLGEQLRQHNELHARWYLRSTVGLDPDGPLPGALQSSPP